MTGIGNELLLLLKTLLQRRDDPSGKKNGDNEYRDHGDTAKEQCVAEHGRHTALHDGVVNKSDKRITILLRFQIGKAFDPARFGAAAYDLIGIGGKRVVRVQGARCVFCFQHGAVIRNGNGIEGRHVKGMELFGRRIIRHRRFVPVRLYVLSAVLRIAFVRFVQTVFPHILLQHAGVVRIHLCIAGAEDHGKRAEQQRGDRRHHGKNDPDS